MTGEMLHVVLFNFDPAKLAAEFPGNGLQESVEVLSKKIPGVLELMICEKNATPWAGYADAAKDYTHCLVSKHKDVAALKVYAESPEHKAVQVRLQKCMVNPPLRMEMNIPAKL